MLRFGLLVAGLFFIPLAFASDARWTECLTIDADADRLACYDAHAARLIEGDPSLASSEKQKDAWFGLERIFERSFEPDSISASVAEVNIRPHGQRLLALENGQVWLQTDTSSKPRIRTGDTVKIRKASMGSFLLTLEGQNKSIRVRRVE